MTWIGDRVPISGLISWVQGSTVLVKGEPRKKRSRFLEKDKGASV